MLPDGGICLGAIEYAVYRGSGELRKPPDYRRVIALVGYADQSISGADEVDDLIGARKEGDDA